MKKYLLTLIAVLCTMSVMAEGIDYKEWMKTLPDKMLVSQLSIPGAHDAGTSTLSSIAKTQDKTITQLLESGVRAFDYRLSYTNGGLYIRHGLSTSSITGDTAFGYLKTYLEAHPSECIFVVLKHEEDDESAWSSATKTLLDKYKSLFVDLSPTMTIGQMRGKVLLMSRSNYGTTPYGAYFTGGWKDNATSTNGLKSAKGEQVSVRIQDIYDGHESSVQTQKKSDLKTLLEEAINNKSTTLYFNHTSGCNKCTNILGYVVNTVEGMTGCASECNKIVIDYMANKTGPMGFIMSDYIAIDSYDGTNVHGKELVDVIINNCYKCAPEPEKTNYNEECKRDIYPWIGSEGKLFGLMSVAASSLAWNNSYLTTCSKEDYYRMLAIVKNPDNYYCHTGYYRFTANTGGMMYLEAVNPRLSTTAATKTALSSLVFLERIQGGGYYIKMQGKYLDAPMKSTDVTTSDYPVLFYPTVIVPGEKVAFSTRRGTYSALSASSSSIVGGSVEDAGASWTVALANDFTLSSSISKDGKYYNTLFAPFKVKLKDVTTSSAFEMEEQNGKAVATRRLSEIPDSLPVLLRSNSKDVQFAVNDNDHTTREGNRVLRNDFADLSYYYFNKAFLLNSGEGKDNLTYYRQFQDDTKELYIWKQGLVIQMLEDRYLFRGDEQTVPLIIETLDALMEHEGKKPSTLKAGLSDWTWNNYNDDILWAGLAFIRGYLITHEQRFLDQAEWAFNFVYDRGWDETVLGGGIWWNVYKERKSNLSNCPAVCMACYLYEATGKQEYLDKAKKIHDWICKTLKTNDGAIYERIYADGHIDEVFNIYSQGTFIEGTAALQRVTGNTLKYRSLARNTIKYVMTNLVDNDGIMTRWRTDGTIQSEFARGIAFYLRENPKDWTMSTVYTKNQKTTTIYDWLRLNADAAWNTRDRVNNITGCQWDRITPTIPEAGTTWGCEVCVSSVCMTNVVPQVVPGSDKEEYITLNEYLIEDTDEGHEEPVDTVHHNIVLDEDGIMRVGMPVTVTCVGNSITQGVGTSDQPRKSWPGQMSGMIGENYRVVNCGLSGTTMTRKIDKISYWDSKQFVTAKESNPQILIIALGTNDAGADRWNTICRDTFKKDYLDMISEFRKDGKNPVIYVALPPPAYPIATSQQNKNIEDEVIPMIRDIASEVGAYVLNYHSILYDKKSLFSDNLHPNDEGSRVIAEYAAGEIMRHQELTGSVTVTDGTVVGNNQAVVVSGSSATLTPEIKDATGCTWTWSGPNNFKSNNRVVTLSNITSGGVYTVICTNSTGNRSIYNFLVSVKGAYAKTITPYLKANGGSWQMTTEATVAPGQSINFGPQCDDNSGAWFWRCPDGSYATGREMSIPVMNKARAGEYGVTYTAADGAQSTAVFTIKVEGKADCADLISYINYGGTWLQTDELELNAGESVKFGPKPTDGSWSWTGPDGFVSNSREAVVSNFSAAKAGEYIATYTNDAGCYDALKITLKLKK